MWFALFALTPFWLLVMLGVFTIWMVNLVDHDRPVGAGFLLALALLFFHMGGVINLFWLWHNPLALVGGLLIYFGVGIVYMFAKWKYRSSLHAEGSIARVREVKRSWLEARGIADTAAIPDNLQADWSDFLAHSADSDARELRRITQPLSVREHHLELTTWAMYWPFSLLWTLLDDWVTYLWQRIRVLLGALLQKVSDADHARVKVEIRK